MRSVHTVESVRAAEDALMATLPAGALMERAAVGLATACGRALGRTYGARVCVLAGTGNNGGDALIAGALLARRGAQVEAVLIDRDRVHEAGIRRLLAAGGRVSEDHVRSVARAALTLDGVLGIGGRPGVRGEAADLLDAAADSGGLLVAVDLPSGVHA
ncbi:MAG TPA: NAD(P)H-hydrate epimerase, partial [Jiangellaceae bacterium]|nr:NAD(P)H-hydrate epimerase [Jiangellaceae bacterium]